MGDRTRRYGLLLPHFGEHASRDQLLSGARLAERLGFDSVWVRDHLVFHPHGMEGSNNTHADPLVTLGAIAGATEKVILGTGALIPHRHPIHTALALASLEFVAGPGRVVCGFGPGRYQHEFDAAGLGPHNRFHLLKEDVEIMRRLWTGEKVDFEGQFYSFKDVDLRPVPRSPGIPIWFCGNAPSSVKRAVSYCDGWMPGRITLAAFKERVVLMQELSAAAGKDLPTIAAIPVVSVARTREKALSQVPWQEMLHGAVQPGWPVPEHGWSRPEDLDGALIAGTPQEVVEGTRRFHQAGLDHIVFDVRFQFDQWMETVQLLGEEVVAPLRRHDPAPATPAA
jgi:probable F420-dependent oxidoreductase